MLRYRYFRFGCRQIGFVTLANIKTYYTLEYEKKIKTPNKIGAYIHIQIKLPIWWVNSIFCLYITQTGKYRTTEQSPYSALKLYGLFWRICITGHIVIYEVIDPENRCSTLKYLGHRYLLISTTRWYMPDVNKLPSRCIFILYLPVFFHVAHILPISVSMYHDQHKTLINATYDLLHFQISGTADGNQIITYTHRTMHGCQHQLWREMQMPLRFFIRHYVAFWTSWLVRNSQSWRNRF